MESHRDCREVLVLTLEMSGHQVRVARDGAEALALLRTFTPRCMVIDTALPDRRALDVVRVARANQRLDGTSIVMVGTWIPAADRAAALAAGVDAVLIKPYEVDVLIDQLSRARRRTPHGQA